MTNFDSVDYFEALDLVEDPYPYFEFLRQQGPAVYLPKHNVVAIVGYEEGVEVLKDHDTFSSINSATGPLPPLPFDAQEEDLTELLIAYRDKMPYGSMLVTQDPPDHTRSRFLLVGLFSPQRMKEVEGFVSHSLDQLIDSFIDSNKVEVLRDYAHPVATLTVAELLGVPKGEHEKFLPLFGPLPGQIGSDIALENNPMEAVGMYFYQYIAERRANPTDDVMTKLAFAKNPDGSLPDIAEIVSHAAVVFGAGQDTTVRLILAALKTLAQNPDLQNKLRNDKSLIKPFIEEALRFDGPTKAHFRLAKRRAKIGDVDVLPGMVVMLMQSAMRRDPRIFEQPNEFKIDRKNTHTQLAFGKGVHTCIGAPLARLEACLAVEKMLARTSLISIDENMHGAEGNQVFEYEANYTQRALRALNLKITK
jgi:cytochrome P450